MIRGLRLAFVVALIALLCREDVRFVYLVVRFMLTPDIPNHNRVVEHIATHCQHGRDAIHSTVGLPWAAAMRNASTAMRDELEVYVSRHPIPLFHAAHHYNDLELNEEIFSVSNNTHVWGALWLRVWGYDTQLARTHFPRTLAAVRRSPLSTAMLSVLEPRRGVDWHYGYFNGILRYHVGVVIPADSPDGVGPRLMIDEDFQHSRSQVKTINSDITSHPTEFGWAEGDDLLFDDTFGHAVKNPTDIRRVVLFSDVVRNDCGPLLTAILHLISHEALHRFDPSVRAIAAFSDSLG